MSDHHDAQDYKANGPTNIGFRTGGDGTGIDTGADLRGVNTGVRARGGDRGVEAESNTCGVSGLGDWAGVFGTGTYEEGAGVVGLGKKRATGVYGISSTFPGEDQRRTADNIGVEGISDGAAGTGVVGRSVAQLKIEPLFIPKVADPEGSGIGVLGTSGSGPGVMGVSHKHRGGVFQSDGPAQVRLVPQKRRRPPKTGLAGDLLAITFLGPRPRGGRAEQLTELWFCFQDGTQQQSARWARVTFDATYP
jgi:hypothetical protein